MIVMSTSDFRTRRASRRAHSNPVNPLPTITTDVTVCLEPPNGARKPVLGLPPLRGGQQGAELGRQPRLAPACPQLAAEKYGKLPHSATADKQERNRVGGDHTIG